MVKENDVVNAVCEYLSYKKDLMFWRQNNVPVFHQGQYRKMPAFSRNGVPDIIVIKDGWFIALECKTKSGRLSEAQKLFRDDVVENGAEYHVVRSVDDVIEIGL